MCTSMERTVTAWYLLHSLFRMPSFLCRNTACISHTKRMSMTFRTCCSQMKTAVKANGVKTSATSSQLINARSSSSFHHFHPQKSSCLCPLSRSGTIQAMPTNRYLHRTPELCRKRKRTSNEPSERFDDMSHANIDEDAEYADEAIEYANELLDRGHLALKGHRVLVVQPFLKTERRPKSESELKMIEAQSLVTTLENWSLFDSRLVTAKSLSKKYMFGQGTYQELTAQIRSQPDITSVFLNVDRLSGIQKKTMEEEWGVPVYDRYEIVLQIFKEHASSKEAKLQIALAELHFRRSHLQQESLDLDQQSGAQQYIGGGGETLLEKKQRQLRDKEGALRKALEKLKGKRELLRKGRERKHFPHVAVVGYTNAGKTSLIKTLTGDTRLEPRNQLFATLDVTSHAGHLSNRMPVIYVDTVGFISRLPHQLIASFAATLEDVLCADLLVHVRDVSHPESENQRKHVLSVLHDLGVNQRLLDNMLEVNNKIDLLQDRSELAVTDECYPVSASQGTGLDQLKEAIEVKLVEVTERVMCDVRIPQSGTHLSFGVLMIEAINMDEAARKALESEVLFYITSALVTFLAFIVSFKWVYRKTTANNVCPVHPDGTKRESITEDKSLQASSGDGDAVSKEPVVPKEDEDDEDDIKDLLIKHDDIKPLDCGNQNNQEERPKGEEEDIESKTQHLAGPQKTKKLVEEVSKMMSDEQKVEERRIQSEQLEAIFKLVQNQQDTFGIGSMEDIEDQFKLYA